MSFAYYLIRWPVQVENHRWITLANGVANRWMCQADGNGVYRSQDLWDEPTVVRLIDDALHEAGLTREDGYPDFAKADDWASMPEIQSNRTKWP